jgi:hypothetical protein
MGGDMVIATKTLLHKVAICAVLVCSCATAKPVATDRERPA